MIEYEIGHIVQRLPEWHPRSTWIDAALDVKTSRDEEPPAGIEARVWRSGGHEVGAVSELVGVCSWHSQDPAPPDGRGRKGSSSKA